MVDYKRKSSYGKSVDKSIVSGDLNPITYQKTADTGKSTKRNNGDSDRTEKQRIALNLNELNKEYVVDEKDMRDKDRGRIKRNEP